MWCCSCRGAKGLLDSVLGFSESDVSSGATANGSSRPRSTSTIKTPAVFLDSTFLGHEVVVVKNGLRVCGTGGALASQQLLQTKSYFEVKLQQDGVWGLGVATRNSALENGPFGNDTDSWILRQTGELFHNKMTIGKIEPGFQEGDIFGISYDHIELSFYVNGVKSNMSFSNVRGNVFPSLFVDEGAVLDVNFDGFSFPPPSGFDRIMKEKTIL